MILWWRIVFFMPWSYSGIFRLYEIPLSAIFPYLWDYTKFTTFSTFRKSWTAFLLMIKGSCVKLCTSRFSWIVEYGLKSPASDFSTASSWLCCWLTKLSFFIPTLTLNWPDWSLTITISYRLWLSKPPFAVGLNLASSRNTLTPPLMVFSNLSHLCRFVSIQSFIHWSKGVISNYALFWLYCS